MVRNSGQIELSLYEGFGGNSYDSHHYADAFRADRPYDFGMQVSKLFSSCNIYNDKVLTQLTMASGNFKAIDSDVYKWTLAGDDKVAFYVVDEIEDFTTLTTPGKGNSEFRIVLDKGWLEQPDVIQLEDNRYPFLEIQGTGQQHGQGWVYIVSLQSSDPTDFVDPALVSIGARVVHAGTSIATEMNDIYGTDQYSSQMDLECQIGAFARKFEVTDKVVRKEIAARKREGKRDMFSSGYAFDIRQGGKVIPRGAFITMAEARLMNAIEMDRELAMTFGKASTKMDITGRYIKRTGPGFRELVKDGHILYHNGSLTPSMLEDFLHNIFLQRIPSESRDIVLDTGEGGMRLFHQILASEANSFLTLDTIRMQQVPGIGGNRGISYGAQFVEFHAINGIRVRLKYNPMKDNHDYCFRKHPDNPLYTVDSFRFDIYDFGSSDGENNMQMVLEDNVESYSYTRGMIDPKTGPIKDGSLVPSFNKGIAFEREMSGGLWVKDTSRIGSIVFEPEY